MWVCRHVKWWQCNWRRCNLPKEGCARGATVTGCQHPALPYSRHSNIQKIVGATASSAGVHSQ